MLSYNELSITKDILKKKGCCKKGLNFFELHANGFLSVSFSMAIGVCLRERELLYAIWLVSKFIDHKKLDELIETILFFSKEEFSAYDWHCVKSNDFYHLILMKVESKDFLNFIENCEKLF